MMPFIELLHSSSTVFFITLAILGLVVGSFLNVVIHRLPLMLEKQWREESEALLNPNKETTNSEPYNLIVPASACPNCGHKIRAWENIPVISYLLLKGACSQCKSPISARYPVVEILSAILTVLISSHFGVSWQTLAFCALGWSLLALTMIDLDTHLLPDPITLPLLWGGLLANSVGLLVSLEDALWGAAAGYLILWSIYWIFKLLTGKEGMGYGDFKLLAALGAWLGWMKLPLVILFSSLVGTLVALVLILLKKQSRSNPIPFGPFLAAAGLIALLWGDTLISAYLQFTGISY